MERSILTVGTSEETGLYGHAFTAASWHWVGRTLDLPAQVGVKIRYRQTDQAATMHDLGDGRMRFDCEVPQRAITPGQIAVAYLGDEVVGSGIIEGACE